MRPQVHAAGTVEDTRLHIALLGYRSNPFSGGQGVYLKYLSKALVDIGHRVDVISGEPYPELDQRVRLIKLPGLNLFAQDNHLTALRPQHLRSATDLFEWGSMATGGFPEPLTFGRRVRRYLKRCGDAYDIVHDNQSLAYGLLDMDLPVVATIHHPITRDRDIALANASNWGERVLIKRWHRFLHMQIRVARRIKHVVTVSQCAKRDVCEAFGLSPHRVEVVPNGIDETDFLPMPNVAPERMRIVSTASADQPLKGTQHLIRALAALKPRYPDLRLTLIGRPREDGPTKRAIEEHGLSDAIEFVHGISTDQIRELYARSWLAVVPSEYEGFGLPAGEAMACGCPVVASVGGALPEVVGDAGILVPVGDHHALAGAMRRLLDDDALRGALVTRGVKRIRERFSWHRAALEMSDVYAHAKRMHR